MYDLQSGALGWPFAIHLISMKLYVERKFPNTLISEGHSVSGSLILPLDLVLPLIKNVATAPYF